MKAVIVCNGSINDHALMKKYIEDADLVICADGGAAHLRKMGVRPDILLGDFDSISVDDYRYFSEVGVEMIRFPAEKDMTDAEIAVELAVQRGSRFIVILGGIGTRLDHSLSNIFLLKKMLDMGVQGAVVDEHNEIVLIRDSVRLEKEEKAKVSLVPLSDKVRGVTSKGLYYALDNDSIEFGSTRGVSNEFVEETAEVRIGEGLLLVIKSRD